MKKKSPVYAALYLHNRHSVLGSMEHGGKTGALIRVDRIKEQARREPVHH